MLVPAVFVTKLSYITKGLVTELTNSHFFSDRHWFIMFRRTSDKVTPSICALFLRAVCCFCVM